MSWNRTGANLSMSTKEDTGTQRRSKNGICVQISFKKTFQIQLYNLYFTRSVFINIYFLKKQGNNGPSISSLIAKKWCSLFSEDFASVSLLLDFLKSRSCKSKKYIYLTKRVFKKCDHLRSSNITTERASHFMFKSLNNNEKPF